MSIDEKITNTHVNNDPNNFTNPSDKITEPIKEPIKEPEYNAWEVWTYLERQRLKTLKLLNTFQAEWEANRFVREAERSAPPSLRVHYEIRPIWLEEIQINRNTENLHNNQLDFDEQGYNDAIDVDIIN